MGKIYLVKQGVMKKNGDGDYDEIARFTNKAEALKKFNAIKHDTKGWSRSYDYLETMIEVFKSEEAIEDGDCDTEIIECYDAKLRG